ncbi:MAG TPA: MarR family transcriptional regulator [Steroidobacteraceae bacterium]|nr:MarR family transcriptional regulator [Steroidobacteraceae bacterium]
MDRRYAIRAEARPAPQPSEEVLSVGYLMGRARASLLSRLDAELERFGLTGMQFAVLKHLADGAARTAADLCRFMQYDTGAMTRIVDRLEQRGLLRRERCRDDRRVVLLRVSPTGRAQLPRLMAVAARVLEAHLAGFSPAEIAALKDYLGRMIANGRLPGDNPPSPAGANA